MYDDLLEIPKFFLEKKYIFKNSCSGAFIRIFKFKIPALRKAPYTI